VRYYANGDVKEKMSFAGGKADEGTRKEFKMVNPAVDITKFETTKAKTATTDEKLTTNDPKKEIKDGYQKLYDDQKRLVQDGEFKGGKLLNGKWYKYDKNGLILKVEIYKNGKYFADGQLDGI
jgi:antitoxin component YwqK of YwqJK toxin-antitoxin module